MSLSRAAAVKVVATLRSNRVGFGAVVPGIRVPGALQRKISAAGRRLKIGCQRGLNMLPVTSGSEINRNLFTLMNRGML